MSDLIKREDVLECIEDAQDGSKKTYDILADVFNSVLALPSAEAVEVVRRNVDHDRDWIIGCLEHDGFIHTHRFDKANQIIHDALSAEAVQGWILLSHDNNGLGTDFPYERDGEWVIVTDGKTISVERIKKDAYDHFFPNGRWFELEDVIAWMPLPTPYKGGDDE